ncbi:uncharacterized protein LOC122256577 [Penaeus japonicus]|uniref:uncharacterized protein LOC122256577 n=1 Tax=Penaeus japonicus TaxID=27405 RepID=UPI001C715781|nr:uncharacterized protein LOC122256577 [Penaeus japonicus]
MGPSVIEHVKSCETCPYYKGSVSRPALALAYDIPDMPFNCVSVDILSGFGTSARGNKYLVFINFSRWCELIPIPDETSPTVAKAFLSEVICRHTHSNVADNGTEFSNSLLQSVCDTLKVKKIHVLPYHPQANGVRERLNRTILNLLRTTLRTHDLDWDEWIPIVQMSKINSTYHATLGNTPHFVLHAYDLRLPYELLEQIPSSIYIDDFLKIMVARKQEAFRLAREHLQYERDYYLR